MAERFQITPGWAAVIVAIVVPAFGGLWYSASASARTETKVESLDKRTEKMEAKLDAIAIQLGVRNTAAKCPDATMQNAGILFPIPTELPPKQATLAGWP